MTKDEALKLALEALEYHTAQTRPIHQTNETISAIKEALANVATNDTLQERVDKTGENVQRNRCPPCHGNCRQGRDCPARGLA